MKRKEFWAWLDTTFSVGSIWAESGRVQQLGYVRGIGYRHKVLATYKSYRCGGSQLKAKYNLWFREWKAKQ